MLRFSLVLILILTPINLMSQSSESFRLMSFNIRYDNPHDSVRGDGWTAHRREKVVALIHHYEPSLLGIQEALPHQLDYLLKFLPNYKYIGQGRDGGKAGEYSAILYNASEFEVTENGTFWLSPTPEKPSKGWDADLPRIVTWGKFQSKKSGEHLYFFNTHFDHKGEVARAEAAMLLLKRIAAVAPEKPVVVSGDFNATPDSKPYEIITNGLFDAAKVSLKPVYGPEGTFSGFDLKDDKAFPRIDYFFVNNVEVRSYETITDYVGSKYPSDHLPVMIEIGLSSN